MTEPSESREAWIESAVSQYERPLTMYAARLLGDVDRARDVVQDTFLKLWKADRAAMGDHLAAWLYTVTRHRAVDELRKDGRMSVLNDAQQAGLSQREVPEPRERANAETRSSLLSLLETLPPRQQEVVRLKFQGGLSYKQIAEAMDLTVSHVGVLIHHAIKAIRQQLDETTEANDAPSCSQTPAVQGD